METGSQATLRRAGVFVPPRFDAKWLIIAACVALTILNASFLAGEPGGQLVLIAHRGTIQPTDPGAPAGGCRTLPRILHVPRVRPSTHAVARPSRVVSTEMLLQKTFQEQAASARRMKS